MVFTRELRKCTCGGRAGILNKGLGKDASEYPVGTVIGCTVCEKKTSWFDGYYEADGTGEAKAFRAWNKGDL